VDGGVAIMEHAGCVYPDRTLNQHVRYDSGTSKSKDSAAVDYCKSPIREQFVFGLAVDSVGSGAHLLSRSPADAQFMHGSADLLGLFGHFRVEFLNVQRSL